MASPQYHYLNSVKSQVAVPEWARSMGSPQRRVSRDSSKVWMILDGLTVVVAAIGAMLIRFHTGPYDETEVWKGTLMFNQSAGILLALLCGFIFSLILISSRLHLYSPRRLNGILEEQRLTLQACLISGLLLSGALYFVHADQVPRGMIAMTVGLVILAIGVRRLIYRAMLYRRYKRGMDTKNVLIVGTGPEARALRHHIENLRKLGYTFKGFIEYNECGSHRSAVSADVLGTLDTLFQHARRHFVDEIFLTSPCARGVIAEMLKEARAHGVDMRVVPDMYDGLAWECPIEYVGHFPTIPLHCGRVPELALVLKRAVDVGFSAISLLLLSPVLLAIALAIKLDSPGPVFYLSERIGKKGRVFHCIKFRTMDQNAELRKKEVMHMNERDGVLFKIRNDPRVTRVGRILRKYSLDELPQFFNVLCGEMSIVGPRPPIASEVREYQLSHLRRLDVTPGITGLWQVQGRQDPSFDSYISLDLAYVEGWSFWLDVKIILRTIGVVLAGTGA